MVIYKTTGGTHEGGIRTPAIIKGGYIENILKDNTNLMNNVCEYYDMIHISDWYHMIIKITGLQNHHQYNPDSDHSSLQLWENIRCKCMGKKEETECDNLYKKRDELIMMRMCGDPKGDYDKGDKFFYSAYVRKGDWKLVVNGSNSVTEACENITTVTRGAMYGAYIEANATMYINPNESYYNIAYWPRFKKDNDSAQILYKSDCLDELISRGTGTGADINNPNYGPFQYNSSLLYDIGTDKVEACAITNMTKQAELFNYLLQRSVEYTVPTSGEGQLIDGSFRTQMASFDCNATYTVPWNDNSNGDVETIWERFVNKGENCPFAQQTDSDTLLLSQENDDDTESVFPIVYNHENDNYDLNFGSYQWINEYYWLILIVLIIILSMTVAICRLKYLIEKRAKLQDRLIKTMERECDIESDSEMNEEEE